MKDDDDDRPLSLLYYFDDKETSRTYVSMQSLIPYGWFISFQHYKSFNILSVYLSPPGNRGHQQSTPPLWGHFGSTFGRGSDCCSAARFGSPTHGSTHPFVGPVLSHKGWDIRHHWLTPRIISILRCWGQQWQGQRELAGVLNKSNLRAEVEESMVASGYLHEWIDRVDFSTRSPIIVVDVYCGKGICSKLASYLFKGDSRISKVVMLDKNGGLDWSHIAVADCHTLRDHRPQIETRQCSLFDMDNMIEWFSLLSYDAPTSSCPQGRRFRVGNWGQWWGGNHGSPTYTSHRGRQDSRRL